MSKKIEDGFWWEKSKAQKNKSESSRSARFARWAGKKVGMGVVALTAGLAVTYGYDHFVEGISDVPRPPVDGECTGSKLDSLKRTGEHTYEAVGMLAGKNCTYIFDGTTGVVRTNLEVGDSFGVCPPSEEHPDRLGVTVTPRRNNGYVELTENAQQQIAEFKPDGCFSIEMPWN